MDISIVIPVWNEEENIRPLCKRLNEVLRRMKKSYEIIFIDDGSTDRTLSAIKSVRSKDRRVRFVSFRRNFGKSAALSAGLSAVKGDFVITMDGDLQDEPAEIPNFIRKINEGYDMVVGWKYKRHDPMTKRIPSKFFNRMTSRVTGLKIHDSNCCFKTMRREVAKNLNIYGELHRYVPALAHWQGYRVTEMKVQHRPRAFGRSKYGMGRLVKGMLDLVTIKFLNSYGRRPMHLFGSLGIASIAVGFLIDLYLVIDKFATGANIGDRPLLLLGVLLMVLGVQFLSLGLLGEMIASGSKKDDYRVRESA
jgi:glycosyltransferase involved in cell wall biosynthesis